jgi:hypothetical protein
MAKKRAKKLNQKAILERLIKETPDIPPAVLKTAVGTIFQSVHHALGQGQTVTLRGFGRFIPRCYPAGPKKVGLLFHPSPRLDEIINSHLPMPGEQEIDG